MLSHGQTVHFRPHSVIHLRKAEHLRIPKFRLKVNFLHSMKRQIFYDTSGMIFFTILKPCRIGPKHQFVPSCPFLFQNQKSKIKININNWYRTEASICPTISSLSISKSKIKNQNKHKQSV